MIDRTELTRRLTMLFDRCSKALGQSTINECPHILNAELTTEEFTTADTHIFGHDDYWPTPQRVIPAAKGNLAQVARQECDALESAGKGQLAVLTDADKAALRAGAYADQGRLPSLRKAFLETYQGNTEPGEDPEGHAGAPCRTPER